MKREMILTAGPSITSRELEYIADAAENGWNSQWSKYINKFESTMAEYVGVPFSHATSSCTGGLHLALMALGVGPGDEVIVPELTWVATASAVAYTGAKPVFIDVDPETWTLDPAQLEKKLSPKTKAIMPVHLYGHPAKMDEIMEFAQHHNIYVVEDAAPAVGAECFGKRAGSFGDLGVFSFQGAKLMVTGEGGMVVANNKAAFDRVLKLNNHGRATDTDRAFWIDEVGYKYRMSNLQAAFGLGQLERVDELIRRKREIFDLYEDRLKDFSGLRLNKEAKWAKSIYWMTSICLDQKLRVGRDELIVKLRNDRIDTRAVFPAISQYPMWETQPSPFAINIGDNAINLPSGHNLTTKEIDYVCERIKYHLEPL